MATFRSVLYCLRCLWFPATLFSFSLSRDSSLSHHAAGDTAVTNRPRQQLCGRHFRTGPPLFFALLLFVFPPRAHTAGVADKTPSGIRVDASRRLVLGTQDRVSSNLFGLTAFEGFPRVVADMDYRARLLTLRPGCIRLAGNIAWCSPKTADPKWYETPAALREFTTVLLFGSRYPTGRFLPTIRQLGGEPMCSLGGVPKALRYPETNNPADFEQWAEMCAGYVSLWKRLDPGLRWVQIWNEPNAKWSRDPRTQGENGVSAAELHIRMANAVGRAIKARFPDVKIGGPVLCWPPAWPPNQKGQTPWYTWKLWTLPWLRETRETVDFFDFHVYDVTADDFAVQLEMVANAAEQVQRRRIPIWITESNYHVKKDNKARAVAIWEQRVLPYARFLFRGVLAQADKLAGNLMHDLHAREWAILPNSADDPTLTYWLLWVFRDLRGLRIVADSAIPNVTTAATVEEDRVTVVVFNDSNADRTIPLDVSMPCGYWTGPTVRAFGPDPELGGRRLKLDPKTERHGGKALCQLQLPAHALASVSFRMNGFVEPRRRRLVREFFGDRTLAFIQSATPVSVRISRPTNRQSEARYFLRLGLLGTTGKEPIACTWNGMELPIKPVALQQIALPSKEVQAENGCELRVDRAVDNPRLALGFAALVAETEE